MILVYCASSFPSLSNSSKDFPLLTYLFVVDIFVCWSVLDCLLDNNLDLASFEAD